MSETAAVPDPPRRLHPATLIMRWLRIVPQAMAGGLGVAFSGAGKNIGGLVTLLVIAAGLGALFAFLGWWRFTYRLGEGEIIIEKGLLQRQRRVIPFDRVQDIAIEQKPLARLLGIAKVKLETGGSAADEGSLDMIALGDAQALRDQIRRRRAGAAGAEFEADAVGPSSEPVLFAMDFRRLLIAGLFNFSLVFLAAIFGVIQYLEQLNLFDFDDWLTGRGRETAAAYFSLRSALAAAALVLLLGMVSGVVRTVARDFGFRLTRAPAGFRRRRGLLTLSEVVIPIRRTQAALIESGIAGRLFGWRALSFQTLGADRREGGVQVAAPFARPEELAPILAEARFPELPPRSEFVGLPRRAMIRRALPWLLLALVGTAGALWIEPWAGVGAGAMVLTAAGSVLRWRKHAYAIGERALFVSGGLIRRRIWIVPYERAQVIEMARGPVQRGLALASLRFDTAGAPAIDPPDIVDLDEGEARRLAVELLSRFHSRRAVARLQPA